MKKTKLILAFLLFQAFIVNSQTIRAVVAGSVTSDMSIGGGNSVNIGTNSGNIFPTGSNCVFIGYNSGKNNSSTSNGNFNSFIGSNSGTFNTTGSQNTFIGSFSGYNNLNGGENTFFGFYSGAYNSSGGNNTFIGRSSGQYNLTGNYNTVLGAYAGSNNSNGSNNVFIGFKAGQNELSSNKLYIANGETTYPLIWGDFLNSQLKIHGKVAIGGNSSTAIFANFPTNAGGNVDNFSLFVKGGILTEELRVVSNVNWADYVFAKDYILKPLSEVENYIEKNLHLPNMPSAEDIKNQGIDVSKIITIQQEKIEELTLYVIKLNKLLEQQNTRINMLEKKIN